jgi:hypothetical protein
MVVRDLIRWRFVVGSSEFGEFAKTRFAAEARRR